MVIWLALTSFRDASSIVVEEKKKRTQSSPMPSRVPQETDGLLRPRNDLLGLSALSDLHRDAVLLISAKTIRLFSFGFLSVMLVVYLKEIGFPESRVGLMFTLTLLGDLMISLLMTRYGLQYYLPIRFCLFD